MIINHNCYIKLVPLVIFIYDARSHIHQTERKLYGPVKEEDYWGITNREIKDI